MRTDYRRKTKASLWLLVICVSLVFSGCGSGEGSSPEPAGPNPSTIAKVVCEYDAQSEIQAALGVRASVTHPTWTRPKHLYSCRYSYTTGSFVLSVKELSSWTETKKYFNSMGIHSSHERSIPSLGQAAFQLANGDVIVRKDWKVLKVNIATLPNLFGVPKVKRSYDALSIAATILGCWNGD